MSALVCDKCGGDLELIRDTPVGPVLHCASCNRNIAARAAKTLKLPGLDPGRQSVATAETEEPIMQRIKTVLEMSGYTVLSTVHRHTRHTCSRCKHNEWHSGGYGADLGIPDLLVRHPSWSRALWLGIETKGTHTRLNPRQSELLAGGAIVVARSEAEALCAVQEADERLKEAPCPSL